MKRIFAVFVSIALLLNLNGIGPSVTNKAEAANSVASGSCGQEVSYSVENNNGRYELIIDGDGQMTNYGKASETPWYGYRSVIENIVIEEGVTKIGNYCFSGFTKLVEVSVPSSLQAVGIGAFSSCSKLSSINLENVTLLDMGAFANCSLLSTVSGATLEYVRDYAFQSCSFTTFLLPQSLKELSGMAFFKCSKIKEFSVETGNSSFMCVDGVVFSADAENLIAVPGAKEGTYMVPDGVNKISEGAFASNQGITSISIPESVKTIGADAFASMAALQEVSIEAFGSIPTEAFSYCQKLVSVELGENVAAIEGKAFYGCGLLESVIGGSNVIEIGDYAFGNCSKLSHVDLMEKLEKIGIASFSNCSALKQFRVSDTVVYIGNNAFAGCQPGEITISERLSSAENGAYGRIHSIQIDVTEFFDAAQDLLLMINEYRTQNGKAPFVMDSKLTELAMFRATETSVYWGHTRPNGTSSFTIDELVKAENIASGHIDAEEVFDLWTETETNRANILKNEYVSVGIGCIESGNTYRWVILFSDENALEEEESVSDVPNTIKVDYSDAMISSVTIVDGKRYYTIESGEPFLPAIAIQNPIIGYGRINQSCFTFYTDDDSVVAIGQNGTAVGVGEGATRVTASYMDDSITYDVDVTDKQHEELNGIHMTHACTIGASYGLVYYIPINEVADFSNLYIVAKKEVYDGEKSVSCSVLNVPETVTIDDTTYLTFSYGGIAAKEMSSNVSAVLYGTKNETEYGLYKDSYSIQKYAMDMLSVPSADDTLKTLLVEMLQYGAKVQTFFDYHTELLADSALTVEQLDYATSNPTTEKDMLKSGDSLNEVTMIGYSLILDDAVSLKVYFSSDLEWSCERMEISYENVARENIRDIVWAEDFVDEQEGLYSVTVKDMALYDCVNPVSFTVTRNGRNVGATLICSASTYADRVAKTGTRELYGVTDAMMKFVEAIKVYLS